MFEIMKKNIIYISVFLSHLPMSLQAYFSQVGQDQYLNENFFKNTRDGFFVDVGAHNGVSISNTYFFEKELGWKGICIEPLPDAFKELKKNRSCICLNCCVSLVDATVDFFRVHSPFLGTEMLSGIVSTYPPNHFERMQREIGYRGGSYEVIKVPSRRLDEIFAEHEVKLIDYLSIDTEGSELDIVKSINFDAVTIRYMTIENNYNDTIIREFIESKGFVLIHKLDVDDVYLNKKEHDQERIIRLKKILEDSVSETSFDKSIIATLLPTRPVIIDIGAHDCHRSYYFAGLLPRAIIHTFESDAAAFHHAKMRCGHYPHVKLHEFRLYGNGNNLLGNEIECNQSKFSQKIPTLNEWVLQNDIKQIDLVCFDEREADPSFLMGYHVQMILN